ncbi:MAG: DNA topoisomerase I [Candidatus Levybacteria bacterium RIFCSPHIGHO2_12_FULL_38_12]|nr:MAG: DNA topoisomerase I [Candidatus Levybacteria bacterium RIFCSPHIGHO2_12_FULL_38_12]OGH34401.1 MAG: DNA topoisomerase I [Candidatus Levybacteria bacterium RIFCSPLOWO2_01_FULL_37_20]OGH44415.1 MAG: DNA topoisomerase I [Candidatus Levybacteria bacterium RIFCSPLOWO2_02_FULL_37_18]
MKLVIVESPTKARTIGKFLGNEFTIKASMGHVMDLPKSTLGVDTENNFLPDYQIMKDKKKTISELKSAAQSAEQIILATDPDREGEAIASHVKDMLSKSQKSKVKSQNFLRIVFHEITKEAIEHALSNPGSIDMNLVNAQTARRVLDRLVGYTLSPLLWQKVRRGLSAGRVQSVALRLIAEREREIEKFKKEEYFTVHAILARPSHVIASDPELAEGERGSLDLPAGKAGIASSRIPRNDNNNVEFELIEINGEKIEQQEKFKLYNGDYTVTKTIINTEGKAKQIVLDLEKKQFIVSDVTQKEMKRSPSPPYITSTLQQDGARRLGFSGKRTMSLAQKLYEEGYITYHRTDSVVLSTSARGAIIGFIKKEFGEKYVQPRLYKTKQKLAQEAHEAIRPTRVQNSESIIENALGRDYARLYEMIWRRAVATQMADAVIESTSVFVIASTKKIAADSSNPRNDSSCLLKANGSVLVFDGFLKVNPQALQDTKLPKFVRNEVLDLQKAYEVFHETMAPPRYNEASLVKSLEEDGIGRPSTYATIISTIEARQYIEREENRFKPTAVGVAVNDFLVAHFSDIDDIPFTATMEQQLDEIASGEKQWIPIIKDFYGPFSRKLETVKGAARVQIQTEETDQKCEKCSFPLVIRIGRFGKFLSCSKFPECDFKKAFVEKTKFTCPKDGGDIIVRKTRKGRKFYGCANYPKCDFAAWNLKEVKNPRVRAYSTPRV